MGEAGFTIKVERTYSHRLHEILLEEQDRVLQLILSPEGYQLDQKGLREELISIQNMIVWMNRAISWMYDGTGSKDESRGVIDLQEAVDEAAEIAKEEAAKRAIQQAEEQRRVGLEQRRDDLLECLMASTTELREVMKGLGDENYATIRVVLIDKKESS
jgi:translation initiation factor 2B subunit (eIF-2B alpha/beta/delta family)